MALILIIIAYYFDYKSNKTTFVKDFVSGFVVIIILFLSALGFVILFNLTLIHGILYLGVEIILLFFIKSLIQTKT